MGLQWVLVRSEERGCKRQWQMHFSRDEPLHEGLNLKLQSKSEFPTKGTCSFLLVAQGKGKRRLRQKLGIVLASSALRYLRNPVDEHTAPEAGER